MRTKQLTESELFKKLNILILDSNKDQLEEVKEKASLLANVEIDNSGFFRGVVEYFYANPNELKKVIPFIKEAKGYNILAQFTQMLEENKTPEEIEKELGIGADIVKKVKKKYEL
ncbi:hypothetical protein PP175_26895 (plasmid) [Aneurinibacillus sp. Ricciae_BoGa-3]|uniref:hypothetical protein n=1 Tax=Aneurinibacillus sp. Ricciae_BoGa-3 TaxID=3022697 RepID=UPI002341573A|nr:hypothetical protein [Aneurinibacillus sp. Ricciae_BoGa-3]WCK57666.1 hypothetical protein PP175_26895 [Aneurinibacillus sp. Ricciae_BoGa-3]